LVYCWYSELLLWLAQRISILLGGAGDFEVVFHSDDDASSLLQMRGNHTWGEFHAQDADDNPYGYGVDTTSVQVKVNIENGGSLHFRMDREDGWVPMYGNPGQYTETLINTTDEAWFATSTRTNYAQMRTCNYGWQNNSQYGAQGDNFNLIHHIFVAADLKAGVAAYGSGSIDVTLMSDDIWGDQSWKLGRGCGCYTNASAEGTGSGSFTLWGTAPNHLEGNGWSAGGGSFTMTIDYLNGFTANPIDTAGN